MYLRLKFNICLIELKGFNKKKSNKPDTIAFYMKKKEKENISKNFSKLITSVMKDLKNEDVSGIFD